MRTLSLPVRFELAQACRIGSSGSMAQVGDKRPWESQPAWDMPDEDVDIMDDTYDMYAEQNISREDAGAMLTEYLLELKDTGVLRANHVCILSWWAHYAGAAGEVERLKFRPDTASGNFHKHLDRVRDAPKDCGSYYKLAVPAFSRKDGRRIEATIPAVPLHEAMKNDMKSMQDPSGLLQHVRREKNFRLLITIIQSFLQIPLQTCTPW